MKVSEKIMNDWQILGFKSEQERAKAKSAYIEWYRRKKRMEQTPQGLLKLGYDEEAYEKWLKQEFGEEEGERND